MKNQDSVEATIKSKLHQAFNPEHIEVINESAKHNTPPGAESHFKVVLISRGFEKKALLDRHREINNILADELRSKIHALSLQAFTPDEWNARSKTSRQTPPCLGGEKT